MPNKPPSYRPPGYDPRSVDNRPSAHQRGYGWRWQRFSRWFLSQPENAVCAVEGCGRLATQTDHVIPHRGDMEKFWEGPFQGLCARHHSEKTCKEDGGLGRPRRSHDEEKEQ